MSSKSRVKGRVMEQTTAADVPQEAVEDAVQATQESLDKVRDILFGSQMRDQDRRFVQIEEKVAAELAAFREETRKGIRSVEEFVTAELSALASRLTAESSQRHDALRQLSDECRAGAQAIDKRVNEFDQQHAAAEAEVRRQLHDSSGALREELKTARSELHSLVEKLVSELRGAKTDRAALAGLFTEMAGKLQG